MRNLYISMRKRPINVALIVCTIGLYMFNNQYLKKCFHGLAQDFFVCYFNDLICPLFFFSYANVLLLTVNKELSNLKSIVIVGLISSFVWEFFAPIIKPSSITDWMDIMCYLAGSIMYWLLLKYANRQECEEENAFNK